jgi:hypothetical protein
MKRSFKKEDVDMKKLIQSKEFRLLLIAIIVVGLGITIYVFNRLPKNKNKNESALNQPTAEINPLRKNADYKGFKAVYLMPVTGGQIIKEDLEAHLEILPVTDFATLASHTNKHIAIWIDKDVISLLPEGWLTQEPQKYYPIIVVGYNNALYSMREKLNLPIIGPWVDWSKQTLGPGFSVWMIESHSANSLPAFMKGYAEEMTASRILEVSNELLKKSLSIIEYKNTQYGFSFSLPVSWEGYSIAEDKWEGTSSGPNGDMVVKKGPIILIRHPKWTSANPKQDIPIMIFTIAQWDSLEQGKFHIGAAPIGPTELGRNSKYVFALPARYNFAFPPGFEEVEEILENNPLKVF